jgi:hypothetical protein
VRHIGSATPTASFSIPPEPPAAVAEAEAAFAAVADRYARTVGEIQDAEAELVRAEAADIRAAVDAYAAGDEPKKIGEQAAKVEQQIATLRKRLTALTVAVDEAGNTLADTIEAHRDVWLEQIAAAEAAAAARFQQAIDDLRAAIPDLKTSRGAAGWLGTFSASSAHFGKQSQFPGGRLVVSSRKPGRLRGEPVVSALIDLAALAVTPEPKPPMLVSKTFSSQPKPVAA